MSNRFSRWATGLLVVAAIVLTAQQTWAIYYGLPPSKDEWKLKYDVEVLDDNTDTVTVVFTLADEGRLKPVHSYTLVAYRDNSDGSKSYDLQARLELKPTDDGKRSARLRIRNDLVGRTMIRVLTLTVDGRPQTGGAALYLIPLERFLPAARGTTATQPAAGVVK